MKKNAKRVFALPKARYRMIIAGDEIKAKTRNIIARAGVFLTLP